MCYTQLERRQQELDASNAFLRREMTEKLEKQCNVLDEEVQQHQKFVLFRKNFHLLKFVYHVDESKMMLKEN